MLANNQGTLKHAFMSAISQRRGGASIRFFAEARLEHEGLDCVVGIDGMVATIAREMSRLRARLRDLSPIVAMS